MHLLLYAYLRPIGGPDPSSGTKSLVRARPLLNKNKNKNFYTKFVEFEQNCAHQGDWAGLRTGITCADLPVLALSIPALTTISFVSSED